MFERMADRLTKTVALPHDLQIVVTDKTPKGFDDPTTEVDGRTIFWPAAFSKATRDVLAEFLPEVIASKGPPRAISKENFTADVLNVWANQFILGHELGHAMVRQLNLPLTGLEEDSADGFATFFTVNDKDTGPNAALDPLLVTDAFFQRQLTGGARLSGHLRRRAGPKQRGRNNKQASNNSKNKLADRFHVN